MPRDRCPCVLPKATELHLCTIESCDGESALRVRVEPGDEGYVRLEQLAYNDDLGWYTQKSFCIPAEALQTLIPRLNLAQCFVPTAPVAAGDDAPLAFPRPGFPCATGELREA